MKNHRLGQWVLFMFGKPFGARGHPCWRNWYLYGYTVYAVIRVRRRAAPLVWVTR